MYNILLVLLMLTTVETSNDYLGMPIAALFQILI